MGMYDIIRCEHKLPFPEAPPEGLSSVDWSEVEFQTKSFSPSSLDHFEISEDGQLYHNTYEYKISDENRKLGDWPERVDTGIERMDFTGEVLFYTDHQGKEKDYWIEFCALYYKGDLREISLKELKSEDPAERIKLQKQLQQFVDDAVNKQKKWWFPLYSVYSTAVCLVLGLIRGTLGLFADLCWKIQRWIT
jgi:hypothetical protein